MIGRGGSFSHLIRSAIWFSYFGLLLGGLELVLFVSAGGIDHSPAYFAPAKHGGYALAAGRTSRYWHLGKVVTVTIGPDGKRNVPSAVDKQPESPEIVRLHVVGDSQVFGWGLSDTDTLPERLQRRLGAMARVINQGLPGLGPLGYVSLIDALPPNDPVLLIFTEMNDFQDAYSANLALEERCGYLIQRAGIARYLPCNVLQLQTFGLILDVRDRFFTSKSPLPLGFNPSAVVSARVLCRRIENGLRSLARRRSGPLFVATIPWEGEFVSARLSAYAPTVVEAIAHTRLPGSPDLHQLFGTAPDPSALFLSEDHHLSPEGAERVAEALTPMVRSGNREEFTGCRHLND